MNGSAVNFFSSASPYFWRECDNYNHDAGKLGGPSAGLLIVFATYSIEFLLGAPSNLWLVCHILRKKSRVAGVPPADFFTLHLALTQLFFYLALPVGFTNHYVWQSNYVLPVMMLLNLMVIVMRPLLLCLMCVERYLAVVRPLDYIRFKARQYRLGCLGVSWCIYILIASVTLVKRSYAELCALFLPVLAIDTFCSLSVLKTLKKPPPGDREMMEKRTQVERKTSRVVRMEEGEPEQSSREEGRKEEKKVRRSDMNSMKKKAFTTIAIIQAVLMLNYLPLIITLPMDGRVPARTLKCQYLTMALAASCSCSYLQPLLYLYRLGSLPRMASFPFRKTVKG